MVPSIQQLAKDLLTKEIQEKVEKEAKAKNKPELLRQFKESLVRQSIKSF
jgi:hypothetical protein